MQALVANTRPHAFAMSAPGEASPKPCVGPILVITFTIHALDQFLMGLVKAGIKDLVRVGGRGKMEELEEYNLINRCRCAPELLATHLGVHVAMAIADGSSLRWQLMKAMSRA